LSWCFVSGDWLSVQVNPDVEFCEFLLLQDIV
jgi:hypothetical protein